MEPFRPAHELLPRGVLPWMARLVPFTGGLTSLPFIAKIALLARLGVAAARIILNIPALNKSNQYTQKQKRTSFYERIFIEGGGTLVYHMGMYLAMDVAARIWERTALKKNFLNGLKQITHLDHLKKIPEQTRQQLSKYLDNFYRDFYQTRRPAANPVDGLLHLNLFGGDLYGASGPRSHHGFLDGLRKSLQSNQQFAPHTNDVIRHANRSTAALSRSLSIHGGTLVQLIGVAVGCVLGGTVIQHINDHVIRPLAQKLSGDDHYPSPDGGHPINIITPQEHATETVAPKPFYFPTPDSPTQLPPLRSSPVQAFSANQIPFKLLPLQTQRILPSNTTPLGTPLSFNSGGSLW